MTEEQKAKRKQWLMIIGVALIFGFIAGITADIAIRYYFSNIGFFQDIYLSDAGSQNAREIIIREPRRVIVEYTTRLDQLRDEVSPAIVRVYDTPRNPTSILESIRTADDYVGQGVVVTSDGWVVLPGTLTVTAAAQVIETSEGELYEIDRLVRDPLMGLTYVKINAQSLPVIQFTQEDEILGEEIVGVLDTFADGFIATALEDRAIEERNTAFSFVRSSEDSIPSLGLSNSVSGGYIGSPVITLGGSVIGVLSQTGEHTEVRPLQNFTKRLDLVIAEKELVRPYLGVNYIDLAQVHGIDAKLRGDRSKGAFITANSRGIAVAADSPLQGVLVRGDIITHIQGQELDEIHSLSQMLLSFSPGDSISISYIHDGESQTTTVTLGETR